MGRGRAGDPQERQRFFRSRRLPHGQNSLRRARGARGAGEPREKRGIRRRARRVQGAADADQGSAHSITGDRCGVRRRCALRRRPRPHRRRHAALARANSAPVRRFPFSVAGTRVRAAVSRRETRLGRRHERRGFRQERGHFRGQRGREDRVHEVRRPRGAVGEARCSGSGEHPAAPGVLRRRASRRRRRPSSGPEHVRRALALRQARARKSSPRQERPRATRRGRFRNRPGARLCGGSRDAGGPGGRGRSGDRDDAPPSSERGSGGRGRAVCDGRDGLRRGPADVSSRVRRRRRVQSAGRRQARRLALGVAGTGHGLGGRGGTGSGENQKRLARSDLRREADRKKFRRESGGGRTRATRTAESPATGRRRRPERRDRGGDALRRAPRCLAGRAKGTEDVGRARTQTSRRKRGRRRRAAHEGGARRTGPGTAGRPERTDGRRRHYHPEGRLSLFQPSRHRVLAAKANRLRQGRPLHQARQAQGQAARARPTWSSKTKAGVGAEQRRESPTRVGAPPAAKEPREVRRRRDLDDDDAAEAQAGTALPDLAEHLRRSRLHARRRRAQRRQLRARLRERGLHDGLRPPRPRHRRPEARHPRLPQAPQARLGLAARAPRRGRRRLHAA
mmetsp:Transcript_4547/g.14232  ORF Transcript_4547/g.14232 Transcript_4547/m.14232 type:complete len:623 (+) Transcript_4547:501-2369(+)